MLPSSLMLLNYAQAKKLTLPLFEGMAQFVSHFAEPGDPEYAPPVKKAETPVCLFMLLIFILMHSILHSLICVTTV